MSTELALPPAERKARVNALLRQVDEAVKREDLDEALDRIRKVFEFDLKNIYARAFEERILMMILEKERRELEKKSEQKVTELADIEVKRRIREFYRKQETNVQAQKKQEKLETDLEEKARTASVKEQQQIVQKDLSLIEAEMKKRISELEQRFNDQTRQSLELERQRLELESRQRAGEIRRAGDQSGQMTATSSQEQSLDQVKIEYEAKLLRVKEQIEQEMQQRLDLEKNAIREEALEKFKEEHRKAEEELTKRLEEERETAMQREQLRTRDSALKVYQTLVVLSSQLKFSTEIEEALLEPLRVTFALDREEQDKARAAARIEAYVEALRSSWSKGTPSSDDLGMIENLRTLYEIPEEEHVQILRRVKKELGLPDENAVIMIIDDDPAILRFVEHMLKKTYKTVLSSNSVEQALIILKETTPSVILCDVQMPGTSGFTFYEQIREGRHGEPIKSVPFLLMSALAEEWFVKTAKQIGVRDYLSKPFNREVLEKTVANALL